MKYLAIDGSTKRSGYATLDDDGNMSYGVIAHTSPCVEKRIIYMRDEFIKIFKEFKPDVIIVEDVRPDGGNAHTGKVLTWLQGILAVAAYEANPQCKFEMVGATSWRSDIGIQGYRVTRERQKQIDIEYANKHWGLDLKPNQDDEADAACLLAAYVNGPETKQAPASRTKIGSGKSAF